jgi:hypothetical protein
MFEPPLPTKDNLAMLTTTWMVVFAILMLYQWRQRYSMGLGMAYAFTLSLIHLTGAFVYSLPHYTPRSQMLLDANASLIDTHIGFHASLVGIIAFLVGLIGVNLLANKFPPVARKLNPQISSKLPITLLLMGIASFFFVGPILRRIPSLGSVANSAATLATASLVILCWDSFRKGDMHRFRMWLASTGLFPMVTLVFLGFAGYGGLAAAAVWLLVLRFYKPRVIAVGMLVGVVYLGLSGYVNYMRERTSIREQVWNRSSLGNRVDGAMRIFKNFKFLDLHDQDHLEFMDGRLNQNDFVGKAVQKIGSGQIGYANGGTYQIALIAWIPRILWPNKPKVGGSGDLVSRYTGLNFAVGTSVGVGHVMEAYINFGIYGVIGFFLVLGVGMGWVDRLAGYYLAHGDYWHAARWTIVGIAMLIPGGNSAELVGAIATTLVLGKLLESRVFGPYYDPETAAYQRPARGSKVPQGSRA